MTLGGQAQDSPLGCRLSLRERKRTRTRRALQEHALRLFAERGYDATTIDDIAEAAEVSPRTFFRYFSSKEAVVLEDEYDPYLLEMLSRMDRSTSPLDSFATLLRDLLPEVLDADRERLVARIQLAEATPALRAHLAEHMLTLEEAFAQSLASAYGRAPGDFEVRLLAAVLCSGLRCALMEWGRDGGRAPLDVLLDRTLTMLRTGVDLACATPGDPGTPAAPDPTP